MFFEIFFGLKRKEAEMFWIEAREQEFGLAKRIKMMRDEMSVFIKKFGDRRLIAECLERYEEGKGIFLPFRENYRELDLSFLNGVAIGNSLAVVCARKRDALARGYSVLGFSSFGERLEVVEEEDFSGFGSENWQVIRIMGQGFTVYLHVRGAISVRQFCFDYARWRLFNNFVIPSRMIENNFVSIDLLRRFLASSRAKRIADVVDLIYNKYREMQSLRFDKVLSA